MDERQIGMLKYHCKRWLKYFETHDKDRCLEEYICRRKLVDEYWSFGLKMDTFKSLEESYLRRHNLKVLDTHDYSKMLDGETDIQNVGNAMFSCWASITHWTYDALTGFDPKFFKKCFRKISG